MRFLHTKRESFRENYQLFYFDLKYYLETNKGLTIEFRSSITVIKISTCRLVHFMEHALKICYDFVVIYLKGFLIFSENNS